MKRTNKILRVFFILIGIVTIVLYLFDQINTLSLVLNCAVAILGVITTTKNI